MDAIRGQRVLSGRGLKGEEILKVLAEVGAKDPGDKLEIINRG